MWQVKDEWIDLAQARHVVVFHNPDVLVPGAQPGKLVPVEHHLINEFKLTACPHCGQVKTTDTGEPVDFVQVKADTLAALNAHHKTLMDYREKHPGATIRTAPPKPAHARM